MRLTKLTKIIVLFLALNSLLLLTSCHKNELPPIDEPIDCETNPEHESCKEEPEKYPYSLGFTLYELKNAATGQMMDAYAVGKYEGKDTVVVIPEVWKGKPVIRIKDDTFANNTSITKVIIPASVNQMGKNVFSGCTSLTEIEFKGVSTLQKIPANTFNGCRLLKAFGIPASVQEIGEKAFYNCTSIAELYIPKSVKKIGRSAFGAMASLTKLTIPFVGSGDASSSELDKDLLGYVFDTLNVYPEFTIPVKQQVTKSNQKTYYIPTVLSTIEIIDGSATTIGFGALSGLTSVTRIIFPKSISRFEDNAFVNSTGLLEICYRGSESDWNKVIGRYTPGNIEVLEKVDYIFNYDE